MDYTNELVDAIQRCMTRDGGTVADIQASFCDLYGFTPDYDKVVVGLAKLGTRGWIRRAGDRYFWHETDDNPLDLRWPKGRPRWLGDHQTWPCLRCGANVDAADKHNCQPAPAPVAMPDATEPTVGPGSIDGGK